MFKGKPVRIPSTLGNLEALAKHLKAKKAILVLDVKSDKVQKSSE